MVIIDSNYIGYLALYTMGDVSSSAGASGIIFGFLSRILNFSEYFQTNDFVFCWDSKHSRRKIKCPFYKDRNKNRTEEEKERLKEAYLQFVELKDNVLPGMGFSNIFQQTGFESDDIIAKIVMDTVGDIMIISSDEDLYQLLYNSKMYNPSQRSIMTASRLKDEYDVSPAEWATVKAIGGCTSDTVPGVAQGIGQKTAIKYLRNQLKTDSVKYKLIKDNADIRYRNEWLVTLPLHGTKSVQITPNSFNPDYFWELCAKYQFNSFLDVEGKEKWERFFKGNTVSAVNEKIKNTLNREVDYVTAIN